MSSTLRRLLPALLLVASSLPTIDVMAQAPATLKQEGNILVAKTREDVRYHDVVERFASLEHLFVKVPELTDAQRDQIERLEETARQEFFRLGLPLREVRRNMLRGWPFEDDVSERSLNALILTQRQLYTDARTLLTPVQQAQFDVNTVAFWRAAYSVRPWNELGSSVDTGIWVWHLYIKPFHPLRTVNPGTVP